ncbi:hypothetical protein AC578_9517 [Pseudocercospora eumusae]|uniref:CN hydrolase domain-containing protein n=1 Tax=Pseudocercospora eumusae TaxID=321146 RepID=A0A139HGI7_9PEZI|nr:hypothetical protein AC578_9517 [Pseudocercospora eumusae]
MDFSQPGPLFMNANYRLGQTWGGPSAVMDDFDNLQTDVSTSEAATTAMLFFGITIVGAFVSYMAGVLCHGMVWGGYNLKSQLAHLLPPMTAMIHLIAVCVLLDHHEPAEERESAHRDSLQTLFLGNLIAHLVILVLVWLVTSVREMWYWFAAFSTQRDALKVQDTAEPVDEEAQAGMRSVPEIHPKNLGLFTMKIAILQFNPTLGEIDKNISHADALLSTCTTNNLDLLVLSEMAFSGYNFSSLSHIQPFLEPTASGPTTQWAIKTAKARNCTVVVGYPEKSSDEKRYNSTVTVAPSGQILANYRKSFLYYTDETWASEGFLSTTTHSPFFASTIPTLSPKLPNSSPVGQGICMDINPYKFSSPWTNYEFATHMLRNRCHLVILSMAWLTRLTPEECLTNPERPDMETVAYWLERFWPFVDSQPSEPIVVVFANRCGSEGGTAGERRMDHGEMGSVKLWEHDEGSMKGDVGLLGKGEEGVLVVDTGKPAGFLLQQKTAV